MKKIKNSSKILYRHNDFGVDDYLILILILEMVFYFVLNQSKNLLTNTFSFFGIKMY